MKKKSIADQMKKDKALFEAKKEYKNSETLVNEQIQLKIDVTALVNLVARKHNYSDESFGADVQVVYDNLELEAEIKKQITEQIHAALKGKVDDALLEEILKNKGGSSLIGFPNTYSKYNF